ncbi:conserved Plasmodium protein, unknown function [Plasmodium malariae]|uniref:Maspardin n=1 Tax=Plasmodium malariae TaxID=5858 RepID=A0A1A8W7Z2_PLAMA|nr:conserved Plasmodium protein, unknown function [Plasmodium malariae]
MEPQKLTMHEAYKKFCSKHPLKKLSMPKSDLVWSYYDINSRNENIVIFLHGICGTAGCYFYQLDELANLGFRVISFQYPCYNYLKDWIKNMCNILEYLNIKKGHFFASDLGGYLIQLYAKLYPSKIESLILCNSYRRTDDFAAISSFRNVYGKLYSFLPHVLLKKIILEDYIYGNYVNIDLKEKNSLEFMSNEIDLISAADLGGRISLQLSSESVDKLYINEKSITILQTLNNMYTDSLNEDMKKAYPFAKHAIMKSGGSFPYLSRYEEVNMYILVHLRNNCNAAFVKEQISNMSYIHRQKSEEGNIGQISFGKNFPSLNEGKHKKSNQESCKIIRSVKQSINDHPCDCSNPNGSKFNSSCCHNNSTYAFRERQESEQGKNEILNIQKNKLDNVYEKDHCNFNFYKHGSYNSYENFSRKDTLTSDEITNTTEHVNNYSYGNYYEDNKQNYHSGDSYSGGSHNGDSHSGDTRNSDIRNSDIRNSDTRNSDIRNSDTRNSDIRNSDIRNSDIRSSNTSSGYNNHVHVHTDERNAKFNKRSTKGYDQQYRYDEQDDNYSNVHNLTNDEFANNPNVFNINHNDGNYRNSYYEERNTIYTDDNRYSNIGKERTYASNEKCGVNNPNLANSEQYYNESLNYQENFNENDTTYNHANVNKNDIFCHF